MKYDLKLIREKFDISTKDLSKYFGIEEKYCAQYEEIGEIPSKYVYMLWKRLPGTPIPEDFFAYTSYTLLINMKYHGLTQTDIKEMFGFKNQSTVSKYMSSNIPMYEMKNFFIENFNPLIMPVQLSYIEDRIQYVPVTDLVSRFNFTENYRKSVIERGHKIRESQRLKKEQDNINK